MGQTAEEQVVSQCNPTGQRRSLTSSEQKANMWGWTNPKESAHGEWAHLDHNALGKASPVVRLSGLSSAGLCNLVARTAHDNFCGRLSSAALRWPRAQENIGFQGFNLEWGSRTREAAHMNEKKRRRDQSAVLQRARTIICIPSVSP